MTGKCYITTVKDFPNVSGKERIEYIDKKGVYGFGFGAQSLTNLEVGDRICFYLPSEKSVVLHAIVASGIEDACPPEDWKINDSEPGRIYYDVEVKLTNIKPVDPPVKLPEVREKLGLSNNWGTYVMGTHGVDPAHFNILWE